MSKEREAFEKSIAANIENFCDAAFDGKYYVMRNNSRLKQRDKEFLILSLNRSWSAWQAAKAQAVPDLGELQERIAGHQYYHDEYGHMVVDMDDVVKEISGFDSWKTEAVPEGFAVVPREPSYKMWGGISRHLCRYAQTHDRYSPKSLKRYFDMFIGDIPDWLNAEVSDWESDHAFATADIGVFIYKAMVSSCEP